MFLRCYANYDFFMIRVIFDNFRVFEFEFYEIFYEIESFN